MEEAEVVAGLPKTPSDKQQVVLAGWGTHTLAPCGVRQEPAAIKAT